MDAIQKLDQAEIEKIKSKKKIAEFRPGDTVKVHCNVVEGDKRRVQVFEGIVTRRRGVGLSANVTVRKLAAGNIGVERTFPLYSATVARIDLVRRGKVRRARLYYLRDRVGKATRVIEGGALSREELDALKAPLELDTGAAPAAKGDKADKKADKKADAGKADKKK